MVLTGFAKIGAASLRRWRRRVPYVVLCTTAVLVGGLAIRLWMTYVPTQADDVVRRDRSVGEPVATVERGAGDPATLEKQVRRTAQAVLPSVVAIRNPFVKPSEAERHQKNYASGVIITADGIVLSQWHVSHWKASEDGDGSMIRWGSSPTGSAGERTTVILHDGRECPAELLGANRTHDVSLLRLLEPGPYPHVPIRATAPVEVGDWVLKIGHPLGYRKDRSAPVRLGRVICGTAEIFGTDYMWCGGDSGGPYLQPRRTIAGSERWRRRTIRAHADLMMPLTDTSRMEIERRHGKQAHRLSAGRDAPWRGLPVRHGGKPPNRPRIDNQCMSTTGGLLPGIRIVGSVPVDCGAGSLQRCRRAERGSCRQVLAPSLAPKAGSSRKRANYLADPSCRLPDGKVVSARVDRSRPGI